MKYIFRYALLNGISNSQITIDQLTEALKVSKFSFQKNDLPRLISINTLCVQKLRSNCDRDDPQNIIRQSFQTEGIPILEIAELLGVWQIQKHRVYKQIIDDSTKSVSSFASVQWSLRTNVSNKNGQHLGTTHATLFVNIKQKDEKQTVAYDIGKADLQRIVTQLRQAESVLNGLLLAE